MQQPACRPAVVAPKPPRRRRRRPPPPESPKPPPAPPLDECDDYECVWCGSGTYDEAQAACDDPAVFDSCPMLAVETPNSLELPLPPPAPLAPGQVPAWTITLEVMVLTAAITDDGTIPEAAMLTAVTGVVRGQARPSWSSRPPAARRAGARWRYRRQLETLVIDRGTSCNDGGACVPGAMTTLTCTITLFEDELTAAEAGQIRSTIETAMLTLKLATGGDSLCSVGGETPTEPDLPPPPPAARRRARTGTGQVPIHPRDLRLRGRHVRGRTPRVRRLARGRRPNRESLGFYAGERRAAPRNGGAHVNGYGCNVYPSGTTRINIYYGTDAANPWRQLERGLPRGVQRPAVHAAERAAARLHDGPVPGPGRQRESGNVLGRQPDLTIQSRRLQDLGDGASQRGLAGAQKCHFHIYTDRFLVNTTTSTYRWAIMITKRTGATSGLARPRPTWLRRGDHRARR